MEKQGLVSEFLMDDLAVMGAIELFPYIFRLKVLLPNLVSVLNFIQMPNYSRLYGTGTLTSNSDGSFSFPASYCYCC